MVTMAAAVPHQRRRPADPAAPVGWWVPVVLVAAGVALSVVGWIGSAELAGAQDAAAAARSVTAAAVRDEQLADDREARARAQRDALAALVVYRCDTGSIRDEYLCQAARGTWRPR